MRPIQQLVSRRWFLNEWLQVTEKGTGGRLGKKMLTGFDYVMYFGRPESDSWVDVDDCTSLVVLKRGSEASKCIV